MSELIERLAQLHGIADVWLDYRGRPREVSLESRAAILAAMGVDVVDEAAATSAVNQSETMRWTRAAPPIVVVKAADSIRVEVTTPEALQATSLLWTLALESGEVRQGVEPLSSLRRVESGEADGRAYRRFVLELPAAPLGYHLLTTALDTGLSAEVRIVVTPDRCYEPAALAAGKRPWGVAVQLYSLRSERNWGMGDFRDLRELIQLAAPFGCGVVGLNPLHALMPANPAHISPYSPSSRLFLNVLYIAVEDTPDYAESEAARKRVSQPEFQALLRELRAVKNVDYVRVAAAKFEILQLLYASFRFEHLERDTPRAKDFRAFVELQGDPLKLHAIYDALDAHWRLQGPQYWGWPSWLEEYRDPTSSAVNRFARERAQEVEYFLYLQWLADAQLREAQCTARECGMDVGLYGDVAVGANAGGSETWSNRRLYLQGASVGAPPDALALKGQDWGVPPQNPVELRTQLYQPFVSLVANNMREVAALRFDHVMALYRLWWVPRGQLSKDGAYVRYPLEDLIAILALESHRNHCVVIGEDLGTVPDAMTHAMERYNAYHYKVLLFEQTPDGRFKPPSAYVRSALATVTTHDLPTLRGWWEEQDLALRDRLDLYPSEDLKTQAHQARASDRRELLHALTAVGLWRWHPDQPLPPYSAALSRAVHAYLGLSNAAIALIQIEDLIGMTDPVNVPGTDAEHPNWQRKTSMNTAEIFARQDVRDILEGMNTARTGRNPNQ
ncbi:MAG TPA: 4-alpha-glucanotransferase [Steroidobacter sp.]|jgi:4-alpha-glucanotransferase|nr:4-alpha-glucanotransferase [Steroidobacter sp.]